MKRVWLWAGLVAIASAAGFWQWRRANEPTWVEVDLAGPRQVEQTFSAEGFVVGKTYDLSPEVPGRVSVVVPAEGDPIAPGQVVLRLDVSEARTAVEEAQAAAQAASFLVAQAESAYQTLADSIRIGRDRAEAGVRQAEARLARVRRGPFEEEIRQARLECERMSVQTAELERRVQRADSLFEAGAISRAARDAAHTELDLATATRKSAEAALSRLEREPLAEDVAAAQAALDAAKADLQQALRAADELRTRKAEIAAARSRRQQAQAAVLRTEAVLEKAEVRCPVRGRLLRRFVEPGVIAAPGAPSLRVVTAEGLHVEAEIRSEDLETARTGMQVEVLLPSEAGHPYAGRIESMSASAENKPDAAIRTRIVRAFIRVPRMGAGFVPGLEVDVRGTRTLPVQVGVPSDCVSVEGDSATVWVLDGEQVRRVPVEIGASDARTSEIVGGLKAGDRIVLSPGPGLRDGMRVAVLDDRR